MAFNDDMRSYDEIAKALRFKSAELTFEIKQGEESTERLVIRAMYLQCDMAAALARLLEEK